MDKRIHIQKSLKRHKIICYPDLKQNVNFEEKGRNGWSKEYQTANWIPKLTIASGKGRRRSKGADGLVCFEEEEQAPIYNAKKHGIHWIMEFLVGFANPFWAWVVQLVVGSGQGGSGALCLDFRAFTEILRKFTETVIFRHCRKW